MLALVIGGACFMAVPAPNGVLCYALGAAALFCAIAAERAGGQVVEDTRRDESARTTLSGVVELVRLVDLSAERLGLKIEYDARTLQGAVVTLRLGADVDDQQLWSLTNQLLATRGLTSVHMPGDEVLSIVKLSDAAATARIEPQLPPATRAGFATVVLPIQHRTVKDVIEAVKPIVSKPGGLVTALGDEPRILLSDLRPRLDQLLEMIELLDVPAGDTVIQQVPVEFLDATQLASVVMAAVTARNTLEAKPLQGRLTPIPDGNAVVVVAPEDELPQWQRLLGLFDQRQAVETRSYTPRYFAIAEVGSLLEQTARDTSPRGSGDLWKVVGDELTGTIIVTATPAEHQRIETLIERLDAVPVEARRPVRAFPIRNRSVLEIVEVLSQLIEAGVLEAGQIEAEGPREKRAARQQTEREVLPSGAVAYAIPEHGRGAAQPQEQASVVGGPPRAAAAAGPPSLVLTADEGTNTLIAIGDARRLAQLEELIGMLDERQAQVMIEALVLSLTDGDTLDLGVELESMQISGSTLIRLSSLFGLGVAGLEEAATPTGAGGTALVLSPGDFRILIRALQTINKGRALNIPKILVSNNQQASLDAVLQEPFLSTNASNTVATTSFGGTQDAGTTVSVTPQIAEGDHLVLEYSLSLSVFVGESSDPSLPPPRQQNNLQSVVTIPDGYTVVVGGLEIERTADAVSQVPLLGDLPLVGELFKNRSRSTSRSRFYMFIRANILRHDGFEDLKFISDRDVLAADVDDGWPQVEPRVIR
jgi:general secretion pathway protein D